MSTFRSLRRSLFFSGRLVWVLPLGLNLLRPPLIPTEWLAVGFVASRSSPNVWRVRSASTDWQAAFRPFLLAFPLAGQLSAEVDYSVSVTSGLRFPALGWQLADSSALRSSPNVRGLRSGLSDVFACRASRPAGWHNCFGLSPTTGDLVLALCVLPLFLHAQAVARCMPEPSLGAPVPSRSLLRRRAVRSSRAPLGVSIAPRSYSSIRPPVSSSLDVTVSYSTVISPCHRRRPRLG